MIGTIFKPFFKRFIGLFISMVFVSMLSVGLLCCFGSSMVNARKEYNSYSKEYGDIDSLYAVSFARREKLKSIKELEEVEDVFVRLTIDAYVDKGDRKIVSRIFSFNEADDAESNLFKRYVVDSVDKTSEEGVYNISVTRKFANNNNFKLGDKIKIGYFDFFIDFYIDEIVETVEGIYPRANNYVWSDNYDFGYMYINELELNRALVEFAENIDENLLSNFSILGLNVPDLSEIIANADFASKFGNQVMIKNASDIDNALVMEKINNKLSDEGIEVTSSTPKDQLPYFAYMENALRQVSIASVFLPVFFYSVTMIVIGLFLNQIIKAMTSQIGIFMSIGIGTSDIIKLFLLFSCLMGAISGILGTVCGYALNILLSGIMKETYSIPTINANLNIYVTIAAILGLLVFIIVTTLITCRAILSITPKDAVISNEAKRKQIPKVIDNFISKAPMTIKLGVNSIVQNQRRFFVSSFSIFASLVLILLATLFGVSKNEMINQSVVRRLNYDCQVYLTEKADNHLLNGLQSQSSVKQYEDCYYTYIKANSGSNDIYLECLGVDVGQTELINIPGPNGKGSLAVEETGIILPKSYAEALKVKKGETISLNNVNVVIKEISYQYFHPITYLSKQQMEQITSTYISTIILNTNDESAFLNYLTENNSKCLTVFTSSLSKDLNRIFDSVDIMISILVGFSIGMAFIILLIMSQNALLEQQRQLSVLRAIGFTIFDISNVWTFQSVFQILISTLFALPVGSLVIKTLVDLASSNSQIYPFIFSIPTVLLSVLFVLLVVISCHLFAMFKIYKWNLADNTRTRE